MAMETVDGDTRDVAERVRADVDALVSLVKRATEGGGPKAQRAAALAITNFEQGRHWAIEALFAEDAVEGDDGGSGEGGPAARVDEGDLPPASA